MNLTNLAIDQTDVFELRVIFLQLEPLPATRNIEYELKTDNEELICQEHGGEFRLSSDSACNISGIFSGPFAFVVRVLSVRNLPVIRRTQPLKQKRSSAKEHCLAVSISCRDTKSRVWLIAPLLDRNGLDVLWPSCLSAYVESSGIGRENSQLLQFELHYINDKLPVSDEMNEQDLFGLQEEGNIVHPRLTLCQLDVLDVQMTNIFALSCQIKITCLLLDGMDYRQSSAYHSVA